MNDREQFEARYSDNGTLPKAIEKYPNGEYSYMGAAHAWIVWQHCAESKQVELDKANARIAQLENATARLLSEAVWQSTTNGWDNRIELDMAKKALQGSSDTWLSEHDKAVEVKILEEAAKHFEDSATGKNYITNLICMELRRLAESRK